MRGGRAHLVGVDGDLEGRALGGDEGRGGGEVVHERRESAGGGGHRAQFGSQR